MRASSIRVLTLVLAACGLPACRESPRAVPMTEDATLARVLAAESSVLDGFPDESGVLEAIGAIQAAVLDPRSYVQARGALLAGRTLLVLGRGGKEDRLDLPPSRERIVRLLAGVLYAASEPELLATATWALAFAKDAEAESLLLASARHELAVVRAAAAFGIARRAAIERCRFAWIDLLLDRDSSVRFAAALELSTGSLASLDASDRILEATRAAFEEGPPSTDERVRWAIVRGWARYPSWGRENAGVLAKLVDDRNWLVSRYAIAVLPSLTRDGSAIQSVARIALDEEAWAPRRVAAKRALEAWASGGGLEGEDRPQILETLGDVRIVPNVPATIDLLSRLERPGPEPRTVLVPPRRVSSVLVFEGKGQMGIRLFALAVPRAVGRIARAERSGALEALTVLRADPLDGVHIAIPEELTDLPVPCPFPRADSRTLDRGTVVIVPKRTGDLERGLWLLGEPAPELRDRVIPIGEIALGARLLDSIAAGDVVSVHVDPASPRW